MNDQLTSTVAYRSNLQPVKQSEIRDDRNFIKHIHDPFALEIMKKKDLFMTAIQRAEYSQTSVHCYYALSGDFPFGTVYDDNGQERVVCKCLNTTCARFKQCRPDFNPSELDVLSENIKSQTDALLFDQSSIEPAEATAAERKKAIVQVLHSVEKEETVEKEKEIAVPEEPQRTAQPEEIKEVIHPQHKTVVDFGSFESTTQDTIVKKPSEARIVVNAGPGTGKTYTLIERIKWMLNYGNTEAEDIMVLCFSRAAVEVIRKRLSTAAENDELPLDWQQVDIRTFDSFVTYMISWVQENEPQLLPADYKLETQNYEQRICTAREIFEKEPEMLADYRHVIIDEVQDLVGVRAEMVLLMLAILPKTCGFTLLGDACQALYDYMTEITPGIMSSDEFYKQIFEQYDDAEYYSLDYNYRQGDELGKVTVPYRKAILTGDAAERYRTAAELAERIEISDIDIMHWSEEEAEKYTQKGTLGILTRTNGQALQISTWLRNSGIDHILQKSASNHDISDWIYNILTDMETEVVTQKEFINSFVLRYPQQALHVNDYWEALVDTQSGGRQSFYEIEDVLNGLLRNAKASQLYDTPGKESPAITVSNIHRAKGREFDNVLVLNDIVEQMSDEDIDNVGEDKVCYVALTRPKKHIKELVVPKQYIYIAKDNTRRCFKGATNWKKARYLTHIEFGFIGDIDYRSFARTQEIQEYIAHNLHAGDRLKLLKCKEGEQKFICYRIVPEEDEHVVLGYTTFDFAMALERSIQRVYENPRPVAYKNFPNIFSDVYIEQFTTCISARPEGIAGAKTYGNMNVWKGISISGFAQLEKDRY